MLVEKRDKEQNIEIDCDSCIYGENSIYVIPCVSYNKNPQYKNYYKEEGNINE